MTGIYDEFDERLSAALKRESARHEPPAFDTVFAAAHRRSRARRAARGMAGGVAVAAAAALAIWISPLLDPVVTDGAAVEPGGHDYVRMAELMGETRWTAPSDVLLPVREIDIYKDLPALMESTRPDEGALL